MHSGLALLLIAVGIVVLAIGGELLVRGAGRVGLSLGLSPAVVGLTIVSVATSAPELAVAIDAVAEGSDAVAVGNIVGSNIANAWLVVGGAAIIAAIPGTRSVLRRDIPAVVAMTLLCVLVAYDGQVSRLDGLVLVLAMAAVLVINVRQGRRPDSPQAYDVSPDPAALTEATDRPSRRSGLLAAWVSIVAGVALLGGGAHLLVSGASQIALALGWSELMIGLTIVAVGTSLPELTTSIMAGVRGHHDLGLGNALGSNVANLGLVLGLTALVCGGIAVPAQALRVDLPLSLLALATVAVVLLRHHRVTRLAGVFLLGCYAIYLGSLVWGSPISSQPTVPLLVAGGVVLVIGAAAMVMPLRRRS